MKEKFCLVDAQSLMSVMQLTPTMHFRSDFESLVCQQVAFRICQKIGKKLMAMTPEISLKFDPVEMLVMEKVFTQMPKSDPFVIEFSMKINQLCLSI